MAKLIPAGISDSQGSHLRLMPPDGMPSSLGKELVCFLVGKGLLAAFHSGGVGADGTDNAKHKTEGWDPCKDLVDKSIEHRETNCVVQRGQSFLL